MALRLTQPPSEVRFQKMFLESREWPAPKADNLKSDVKVKGKGTIFVVFNELSIT
jgi:hypothetical protein